MDVCIRYIDDLGHARIFFHNDIDSEHFIKYNRICILCVTNYTFSLCNIHGKYCHRVNTSKISEMIITKLYLEKRYCIKKIDYDFFYAQNISNYNVYWNV